MPDETIFAFGDFTYSIINFNKRTCRTGTGTKSAQEPNAMPNGYSKDIIIPSQVSFEDKLFLVTEIGPYSFFGSNSPNIKRVFIPYSVEIIREWGLARLLNCEEVIFEFGSCLSKIETYGLYDFYQLKTIKFTSKCLKEFGESSMRFAKDALQTLIIPGSVNKIERISFGGMAKLKDFYYCGLNKIEGIDIFESDRTDYVTPYTLIVHVLSNYPYDKFGERSVTKDADDKCKELSIECKSFDCFDHTISQTFNLDLALFMIFCTKQS